MLSILTLAKVANHMTSFYGVQLTQFLAVFNQILLLIEGSKESSDYCDHHLSTFFLDSKGSRSSSFCLKVWIKQVNYIKEDAISSSQNPSPKDDKYRCQTGISSWDNGCWTTTSKNYICRKGIVKLFKFILEIYGHLLVFFRFVSNLKNKVR